MNTTEEFWAKLDKANGCWEWRGCTDDYGYGRAKWKGRAVRTHRLSAFLSGLVDSLKAPKDRRASGFVLHRCDNRRCCNPEHLFVGTQTENMLDMYNKGRHPVRRGENNEQARLSNGQAAYARALYATGKWKQSEIAGLMGVHQTTMSKIINGNAYR